MKKENPNYSFDWYFTDISERDGARFHALNDKKMKPSFLLK